MNGKNTPTFAGKTMKLSLITFREDSQSLTPVISVYDAAAFPVYAAAPKMEQALRAIVDAYSRQDFDELHEAVARARDEVLAAIPK